MKEPILIDVDGDDKAEMKVGEYLALWGCDPVYDHFPRESGDGYAFYNYSSEGDNLVYLETKLLPALIRQLRTDSVPVERLLNDHDREQLEKVKAFVEAKIARLKQPEIVLDPFTRQYLVTALWAETDDDGQAFDSNYDIKDFHPDAIAEAKADCAKFQADNAKDLADLDTRGLEIAGHDFWLTRRHHGAGFWDGDWEAEMGQRLTAASQKFPDLNLYVGDDGLLYFD